jgi:tetratricopeptide (TPR) repeat protein
MTEALIGDLAKIRAPRVISRTSVMQYKGVQKPLREIADELDVDAVVEGSVLRSGDRVRISVQLVQASPEEHLWAENYERSMSDVLALQSEVARAIASEVKAVLTPQEESRLSDSRTVDPEAYEAYLKGRHHWNRRTGEGYSAGLRFFEEAIQKDPTYALAHVGVADTYLLLGYFLAGIQSPSEAMPMAKASLSRALEIDRTSAEAFASRAYIRAIYDYDWLEAEEDFKRAIELGPGYATARQWYSVYLTAMGRHDEALVESRLTRKLDPLSGIANVTPGWTHYFARQYDRAIEEFERALELDHDFVPARLMLGWAYTQKGLWTEAIDELRQALETDRNPALVAKMGEAYAVSGKRTEALEAIRTLQEMSETRYVDGYHFATVYAGLGEKDQALEWLFKAFEARSNSLILLNVDPVFDSLRSDPRFQDLLRRMNFPE